MEIYIDILEEVRSGVVIPTRIMYGANLSWKPLLQILTSLVNQELIEEFTSQNGDKRSKKEYRLTEKGANVLRYFNKAKELVEQETVSGISNWK